MLLESDVGVMGGESGDVVAAVESYSVSCVSVKFDWSSMLFVELQ